MIAVVDKESVSCWSSAAVRWKLLVILWIKRIIFMDRREKEEYF